MFIELSFVLTSVTFFDIIIVYLIEMEIKK